MNFKVSVLVPMYNSKSTINECIKSLINQDYRRYEIIVVDDGSTDSSIKKIINKKIILIKNNHNGPAAARNTGLRSASGKIIAFTDADCVLPKNWLSKGVISLVNNKRLSGVTGPAKSLKNTWVSRMFDLYHYGMPANTIEFVQSAATQNLFCWKKHATEFDERLKFGEDIFFSKSLKKHGKILFTSNLTISHHNPTSLGSLFKKWFIHSRRSKINLLRADINFIFDRDVIFSYIFVTSIIISAIGFIFSLLFIVPLVALFCLIPTFYFYVYIFKLKRKNIIEMLIFSLVHSVKRIGAITGTIFAVLDTLKK